VELELELERGRNDLNAPTAKISDIPHDVVMDLERPEEE